MIRGGLQSCGERVPSPAYGDGSLTHPGERSSERTWEGTSFLVPIGSSFGSFRGTPLPGRNLLFGVFLRGLLEFSARRCLGEHKRFRVLAFATY